MLDSLSHPPSSDHLWVTLMTTVTRPFWDLLGSIIEVTSSNLCYNCGDWGVCAVDSVVQLSMTCSGRYRAHLNRNGWYMGIYRFWAVITFDRQYCDHEKSTIGGVWLSVCIRMMLYRFIFNLHRIRPEICHDWWTLSVWGGWHTSVLGPSGLNYGSYIIKVVLKSW